MENKSVDLVALFKKESKNRRYLLISSAVFLFSSILPWIDVGFLSVKMMTSGWVWILFLANFSALFLLVFWILLPFGIRFGGAEKNPEIIYKVLASLILGSVLIFILQSGFAFTSFGIGLYIGFLSALAIVFFAFELKIEDLKEKLKK